MRIAVIADIHGNSAALEAVISDIAEAGVDLTVNLGDCLAGPLDAAGTARRLMGLGWPTVMGNHDRWMFERAPEEMFAWDRCALAQVGRRELDWLRGFAPVIETEGLLFCHGTPGSDTENWLDNRDGANMKMAPRAQVEAAALGVVAEGFLCGHTHVQRMVRLADGRLVVNPGSVGCPGYAVRGAEPPFALSTGATDARYAILERRGGTWRAELRHVPYDAGPMAALARAVGDEDFARVLEGGWAPPL